MTCNNTENGWNADAAYPAGRPGKRILIILHQQHSTPGHIGLQLRQRGYVLDQRRPALGDPLPEDLDPYAGIVLFGGPMSVNDPYPWIRTEIDLIGRALAADKPILGICLGAQLMAVQLGATVACHRKGLSEMGYYPMRPTPLGARILPWPSHVYHWHSEGFDLPAGAELLASGQMFPNQAFRYGQRAFAVQFHPEVTHDMMSSWTRMGADRLSQPGAQPAHAHLAGWTRHDPQVRRWLTRFLDLWLHGTHADTTLSSPLTADIITI